MYVNVCHSSPVFGGSSPSQSWTLCAACREEKKGEWGRGVEVEEGRGGSRKNWIYLCVDLLLHAMWFFDVLQCIEVCCSVLQCVATGLYWRNLWGNKHLAWCRERDREGERRSKIYTHTQTHTHTVTARARGSESCPQDQRQTGPSIREVFLKKKLKSQLIRTCEIFSPVRSLLNLYKDWVVTWLLNLYKDCNRTGHVHVHVAVNHVFKTKAKHSKGMGWLWL